MAAEIQALVLVFDYEYIVKDLAKEIIRQKLKMEVLLDSRTVFNVVEKKDNPRRNASRFTSSLSAKVTTKEN